MITRTSLALAALVLFGSAPRESHAAPGIRFQFNFPGLDARVPPTAQNIPEEPPSAPISSTGQPALNLCESRPEDLRPIDCVSAVEVSRGAGTTSFPLTMAQPAVQGFIRHLNEELIRHRLSDEELAEHSKWRDEAGIKASINYSAPGGSNTPSGQLQEQIDDAFIKKALAYIDASDRNELVLRDNERAARETAEANDKVIKQAAALKAARDKLEKSKCPNGVLEYGNLAMSSPYATKGHCYHLPIVVVSQWVGRTMAMANLRMVPVLIDFSTPPDKQVIFGEALVVGEGAFQYQDVSGALRTIPRVRLVSNDNQ